MNTSLYFSGDRLVDFYIGVGHCFNSSDTASFDPTVFSVCHYQKELFVGTAEFHCADGLEGRFVTVYFLLESENPLTLCEVEVYGNQGEGELLMCTFCCFFFFLKMLDRKNTRAF